MRIELLIRPRLLRSLQSALQSGHVLITAPAGYGKTVLLHSLAAHHPHAYYLPMTPADVDLPHLQGRVQRTLRSAPEKVPITLLLDDVHHLEGGPEALDWLVAQLEREAPRLVLVGRRVPSPAVRSLVRRGEITHLDTEALAFTVAEGQAFLGKHYAATPELVAAWYARTGGWPLALALLARVQAAPDPRPVAEEELFTYLSRTLAQTLSPELLRFWTLTAVPLRFNDELAARLLGGEDDVVALRQEVQRRNLFLEPAQEPGWFRYHELIREFLLQQTDENLTPIYQRVVTWFEAQGDLEMAIEHALAGRLFQEAARLILQLPHEFVWDHSRHFTYRRWVLSLDESTRAAHPELLIRLGTYLHYVAGWEAEAWRYLRQGLQLAETNKDVVAQRHAHARMASLYFREGRYADTLAYCRRLLDDPHCQEQERLYALRIASLTLTRLARYREANKLFHEAIALAAMLGDKREEAFNRTNHAITVLIPLGRFVAAHRQLEAATPYTDEPGVGITTFLNWCELYAAQGDWEALSTTLQEVEAAFEHVEVQEASHLLWWWYYHALLATGRETLDQAQTAYARAAEIAQNDPFAQGYLAWLEVWLHRRQNDPTSAVKRADKALAESFATPLQRALLALERDIAAGTRLPTTGVRQPALHLETLSLISWRARAELVRLRALLALRCWHAGDPRWRRHVHAALFALRRPGYEYLLTQRDPGLGAPFWTVVLAGGVTVRQAVNALQAIGNPEPVLTLLQHETPAVRTRAAQALAAIGREEAMPPLATALSAERDKQAAATLKAALTHLESQPPPPLQVKLLGDFALWRGGRPVPDAAWQRPVVRRLFQYFALHRGEPLPRDRILDDLWPQSAPQKAWASFRTVYSKLRPALDPYLRPKAPSRYVAVEGLVYRFDPHGVVQVDVQAFRATVQEALTAVQAHDVPPLPEELLAALAGWAPLLPELPYEEWLLEPRERLHDLYVEGCLYVAQALLVHGRPGEAEAWARRTVEAAPWLEEGYQALMRAYARQGQRGLALKAYDEAVEALRRELEVTPSSLTRWLAERLRQGEGI